MSARVIGLTGQTGAGKSTVCALLRAEGFFIIDCDQVARHVVRPGMPALEKIVQRFGPQVLLSDGTLNRRKLAGIVFSDSRRLQLLNEAIDPAILEEIKERMAQPQAGNSKGIVLDAPTLFESGANSLCDIVVSVLAHRETRYMRILNRDGLSPAEARARLDSQREDDFYRARSDYILYNDGTRGQIHEQARRLIAALEKTG